MTLGRILCAGCLVLASWESRLRSEIEVWISPTQFVRGGPPQELRVLGPRLALLGLEFKPADGITAGEMKVREPLPADGLLQPAGIKVWTVVLLIDPAAAPGERTVVAVTSQGRSAEMPFKLVAWVPTLADPRNASVRLDPGWSVGKGPDHGVTGALVESGVPRPGIRTGDAGSEGPFVRHEARVQGGRT